MVLKKITKKGKKVWAIVSKKTSRPLQYFGSRKPSQKDYIAGEKRINMFRHIKTFSSYRVLC